MKYFDNTSLQANFLIKKLKIDMNSRGLDITCGSGSCLQEIQKLAPDTFGVDVEMSELVNFYQSDIFKNELPVHDLDFAYCMAPYFGEDWWNIDFLFANISKSLKTGGLFCLDLFNFNSFPIEKTIQKYKINEKNIQLSTVKREVDRMTGSRSILQRDWSSREIPLLWRVFEKNEIQKIALSHSLEVIEEYSDFEGSQDVNWQPNLEEKRILLIFKKI